MQIFLLNKHRVLRGSNLSPNLFSQFLHLEEFPMREDTLNEVLIARAFEFRVLE